jgi:hypothetical protein
MSKKKGSFIDQFLDKIILGLTAIAALYLLWAFVLSNPYGQQVGGRKVSPSQIDVQNERQSRLIVEKLEAPATPNPYVQDKSAEFSNLLECAMPRLSIAANWPLPGRAQTDAGGDRIYVIPQIPALENVKLASIRGVVRMPTEEITLETPYTAASPFKPVDMDMVTLSAHLDVQTLYNNFRQSFMGMRLKPQWRDPTYAEPVLVRVELQRRVLNADGSWGQWQTVPFTRIDPYQKMFKELPLTTEQITYGNVELFINSYREFAVMKDVLQPEAYGFLSLQTKWLPAEYYLEYRKISDEEEAKKLREERERRLRGKESAKGDNNNRTGTNRPQPQPRQPLRRGGPGGNPTMDGMGGGGGGVSPVPVTPVKPTRTTKNVEQDATTAVINEKTKLGALKDMTVWIHDDTVVAGAAYQYRIRCGAFNPIAGRGWCASESKEYNNQVVLWSAYTELSEPVRIPKMLHMFPMDILADGTGVTIDIYKYYMGQWHTETFEVRSGQMIGKPMEPKSKTNLGGAGMEAGNPMLDMGAGNPALGMNIEGTQQQSLQVDYSTGYMLMDVQAATNWFIPGVRPQEVSSMLYLDDNNQILALATKKSSCWSKELNAEYNTVKQEMIKAAGAVGEGIVPGMEGMPPEMRTKIQDGAGL